MDKHDSNLPKDTRKKQGVFYSPQEIARYIVKEVIISFLESQTDKKCALLNLSLLDPACGDGTFLVVGFEILLQQYTLHLPTFENPAQWIIENNLFGVDIDAETVQICQEKLQAISGYICRNIKQGNSLIDDKTVDALAYDWTKEFPKVMKKGGFTLVVGNPPYVDIKTMDKRFVDFYFAKYETAENRINLYSLFIERALNLLAPKGILSFIIPNSLLVNSSYLKLRLRLLEGIEQVVKLPDNVFEEANVETIIFKYQKNTVFSQAKALVFSAHETITKIEETPKFAWQTFNKVNWNGKFTTFNIYAGDDKQNVIRKCFKDSESLGDWTLFSLGITPYDKYRGHSDTLIKNKEFHVKTPIDGSCKPLIAGEHITRYHISEQIEEYIKYGDWLGAKREEKFFTEPRIIVRQILSGKPSRIFASFTDKPLYFTQIGFGILPKDDTLDILYLLAILNSNLLNFVHKYKFTDVEKDTFNKVLIENCKNLPIKIIPKTQQQPFIDCVQKMLLLRRQVEQGRQDFLQTLSVSFGRQEFNKRLFAWYELEAQDFFQELKKLKIKVPLKDIAEWSRFFEEEKDKLQNPLTEIQTLDSEIEALVYALYDLSPEEIDLIENG